MSTRPLASLKETAARLAHLLNRRDGDQEQIQALARELEPAAPQQPHSTRDNRENPVTGDRVGIWTAECKNGKKYYQRHPRYKNEFDKWAGILEIPPKGNKKRIVFLGESVARGALLEPFYTPAAVLETLLNSEPGAQPAEVIDLAKTGCQMDQLQELYSSCMVLKPDVIIIFAGNNWERCFEFNEGLVKEIIGIMDTGGGFPALRSLLEGKYRDRVSEFIGFVGHLSKTNRVPVIFIIPGYNLMDFRSNWFQRIDIFPRGETGRRLKLVQQVEASLDKGENGQVEAAIRQIIDMNEGNPYGYELMAQYYLRRGQEEEAGEYLQKAADTALFRIQNVPCCYAVTRNTLLEEAVKYDIALVDLPALFKQVKNGKLPDREIFLDYCHLTVEGIRWAMAAAARCVFSLGPGKDIPLEELKAKAPEPDSAVAARSHFFAAIHNAHRGEQPYELLHYHCCRALKKSLKIKDLMIDYIEMATSHSVWSLTRWCEKMFETGEMTQFPFILQPHNHYTMDIQLVDAMTGALAENGIPMKEKVLNSRKQQHGFKAGKVDLLESYYHLASYVAAAPTGYYKAYAPRSVFFLVTGSGSDVELQLTYRVPQQNQQTAKVVIRFNDEILEELPSPHRWQSVVLAVPRARLQEGVNRIALHWPPEVRYSKETGEESPQPPALELLHRRMYPLYGEIHMFYARI